MLNTAIDLLAALVFIVPIFAIYEKCIFHDIRKTIAYGIFGMYLAAVFSLVGFPDVMSLNVSPTINLIPLIGMASDFTNACLNILLFIPLGIFLPVLCDKYRNIKNTILAAFCMSLIIEVAQVFTFRTTDINDVITNTMGACIGVLVAIIVTQKFTEHIFTNDRCKEIYIIYITIMLVVILPRQYLSMLLWNILL